MTIWQAIILGLVEGITEYLPVSSTGHLILTAWLLGLGSTPESKAAVDAFTIIIQGGAILAVLGLYRTRVLQILRGLVGRDRAGLRLFVNLLVAFLPAVVLGVLLDETLEALLFWPVPILSALFVGGVVLLLMRRWHLRRVAQQEAGEAPAVTIDSLTPGRALVIGLLQCVAMWPGTSRSMVTIVGGMLVGLPPAAAAEFSFLLGLPTLSGACVYKLAKSISHDGLGFVDPLGGWIPVLVGIAVATISAAIAVKWLVGYLSRHSLAIFGWWRIAVALVLGALVVGGKVSLSPDAADAAATSDASQVTPATSDS